MSSQSRSRKFGLGATAEFETRGVKLWSSDVRPLKSVLVPDLRETLAFAVIVEEHIKGVALANPSVQLREKLSTLRLGNLRFRRAFCQSPKCVQAFELCGACSGNERLGLRRAGGQFSEAIRRRVSFGQIQHRHPAGCGLISKLVPADEERLLFGNL